MKDYLADKVRNICLVGHSGSGKTTTVESILYFTKSIERMGNAADGTLTLDYDTEEVKRGLSIYTAVAPVEWKDCKINFIDAPGYLDYVGEMEAALDVADNALIVVGAKEGIQAQTEKAFKKVVERKLPTIFFINKIDEENASFDDTYRSLREKFGKTVFPFEVPIIENNVVVGSVNILKKKAWYITDRENAKEVPADMVELVDAYYNEIAETVAMEDEQLMEKYFSEEEFTQEEIAKGLMAGVRNGDIRPVYCGSAIHQVGIERLLDLIIEFFPSYAEKNTVEAVMDNEKILLATNEKEAVSALVYKTIIDPFVGRISFVKVMSGVLSSDSTVFNVQKDKVEKISQIFIMKGKYQVAVGKLFTGDLGAIVKLQHTQTNNTLATKDKPVIHKEISFPKPMLQKALWPKSKNDEYKLSESLQKLMEEDLSCNVFRNSETEETILSGVGEQHIEVLISKLKSKYKVEVDVTEPTVQYRETICSKVQAEGKHKKQSGGAGQYGHCWVEFEPCDCEEMVFEERVFGGSVPRQYFPAVENGLRKSMEHGVLAGFKMVGVKATLYDGSYHDVDSKEIAFESAAKLAYKNGIAKAKPIILEPIGTCNVLIPEEYTGTIIGDFNKRRGMIMGVDLLGDATQKIEAEVPMAEMQKYATELRSMTQGRGEYYIEFSRYEPAPTPIADKVILSAKENRRISED